MKQIQRIIIVGIISLICIQCNESPVNPSLELKESQLFKDVRSVIESSSTNPLIEITQEKDENGITKKSDECRVVFRKCY